VEDDRRRVATGGERRPEPVGAVLRRPRITGPILVLVFWAALGSLLALALGGRIMNRGSGRRGSSGVSSTAFFPRRDP
jgi:hypothetical protein